MSELVLESTFAGCRIEGVAGRGGMGIVYRATQLPLGRPVALKLVAAERAADRTFHARFERETRVAAAIDHPNVIPVYEAGESEGRLYLVMRWVEGGDLHDLIRQSGGLDPSRAASIVAQVGSGLDAAHGAGLVHRDVKPANVLITGEEGAEHVYLTDFGLTLETSSNARLTQTGEWIGTADFMAPEQFEGQAVDPRTDVYALGCVLHAALTGRPPFARQRVTATMLAHLRDPAPRPSDAPGVPQAFDGVVARALAKRPSDRYSSAGELAGKALAAAGLPVSERTPPAARKPAARNGNSSAATTALPRTTVALPASLPPPPTARISRARGRLARRALLPATLVVALGAAIAAVLLLAPRPFRPGGSSGPLTQAEVRGAVGTFARAYAREDAHALAGVLTSNAARVTPTDTQRGAGSVLAEYRRQFGANRTTNYVVSDLEVRGGPVGRAGGRYVASRSGARPITGRIVFGVRREHSHPRIGLIAVTPDR